MGQDKGTPTTENEVFKINNETYLVRVRRKDPKTGKPREYSKKVTLEAARADHHDGPLIRYAVKVRSWLHTDLDRCTPDAKRTRFEEFANTVIEERIALGKIASPETKMKYRSALKHHLVPDWGDHYIDAITRVDVHMWLVGLGRLVQARTNTPETVNTWWSAFRMIMRRAAVIFDIKDPTLMLESIPKSAGERTYTTEEPNSLLPAELPAFFDAAWNHEREHFAMLALGTLTGRRACELRPLRRQGRPVDLNWETGEMQIRRSQTIGEAMDKTKQKRDVVLFLPPTLIDILRTHVANLNPSRMDSPLLFPPRSRLKDYGPVGYMSKSALDKPIRNICEKAGIKKHLTAKGAMRRTYQDLCRAAEINETVQRAMSGHATKEMMELYSSASAAEKRGALARMSDIAGLKAAARL